MSNTFFLSLQYKSASHGRQMDRDTPLTSVRIPLREGSLFPSMKFPFCLTPPMSSPLFLHSSGRWENPVRNPDPFSFRLMADFFFENFFLPLLPAAGAQLGNLPWYLFRCFRHLACSAPFFSRLYSTVLGLQPCLWVRGFVFRSVSRSKQRRS